jgi:Glycosyl transferase family 21
MDAKAAGFSLQFHSQKAHSRRNIGVHGTDGRLCTYLLPIRRAAFCKEEALALARYFRTLRDAGCEMLVVDGSAEAIFSRHAQHWANVCRHERVDRRFGYLNDKANGIHTGIELATNEKIILADDDVRYDSAAMREILQRLERSEVVRPQNFLAPLPWWAAMEASRMLINRATLRAADYPGTCAFRRSTMLRAGHYDGDVLFDNEEIIRHFAAEGVRIDYGNDLFVCKKAPGLRKWIEQRARQAYEDFPLRTKTFLFASIWPMAILLGALAGWHVRGFFLGAIIAGSVTLSALGRRRGQARKFFPGFVCLFAPLWVFERALSTYWAMGWYWLRGGYPFGDRMLSRGVGRDWFGAGGGRMKCLNGYRRIFAPESLAQRNEEPFGKFNRK